jgi:hypothetical protein
MRVTRKLGPQELWARIDEGDARIRAEARVVPLFGLDGWTGSRMTGDWGWENDRLVVAGLEHGDRQGGGLWVHVQTTSGDPEQVAFDHRMSVQLAATRPDRYPAVRDRLAADPGTRVVVTVENTPCEFRLWRDDAGWTAAARHGDAGLVVEGPAAADITQVRLVRVTDIEPYIAGRRAWLRRARGEDS